MAEIQSIVNVTASHSWVKDGMGINPEGSFKMTLPGLPSQIDEIVVRAINWNGEASDVFLYLLWSNITNNVIASFCGGALNPHFPQTRIKPSSPIVVPNVLEFKLYHPRTIDDASPTFANAVVGDLAIHLELITYKKS
jgi:hypothetical protein